MDCTGGFVVDIRETTLFRPGEAFDGPAYSVSGVRIEDGIMKAGIEGDGLTCVRLDVGESVVAEGVGTFTLLDVIPRDAGQVAVPGGGGTASFCFHPDPSFQVDPTRALEK